MKKDAIIPLILLSLFLHASMLAAEEGQKPFASNLLGYG